MVVDLPPLVIIGGNSLVAPYLMHRLRREGRGAEVISRNPINVPEGFNFTAMDLAQARNWIAPENAIVISLLPLWILATYLPRFIGVRSIIALGSTSVFGKADSPDRVEKLTVARLEDAEVAIREWCRRSNVHGTILRPTMIYDGLRDTNVVRMEKFVRRFRFLPLAAPARGLRQPIHADDVAKAILKSIGNAAVFDKTINIGGGEVLSYRAMAERVFTALGLKPRVVLLPENWLENSFRLASKVGLMHETAFGSSIFRRMNQDLTVDMEEATRLLDFHPRGFEPQTPLP